MAFDNELPATSLPSAPTQGLEGEFYAEVCSGSGIGSDGEWGQAASYQLTDGTVVDPIQSYWSGDHTYSGPNLEPGVVAPGAGLHAAILNYADLTNANLSGADLGNSSMIGANLTGANLSSMPTPTGHTNLLSLVLTNANLTNANLTGTNWISSGVM